ncbi:MAG: hemagglutinin repeat-containing protein, partial [Neisseriaceae bacterium]|nr:hemagglutinin repeat-containing protein [Neisseriaceae bacterium]
MNSPKLLKSQFYIILQKNGINRKKNNTPMTNTQDYYNQVDKSGFSLNVNVKSLGDNLKKATKQAVKMASPSYMAYEKAKNKKDAYEQNKGDGAKGEYDGIHAAATSSLSQLGEMSGASPIGFNLTHERSQTTANNRSVETVGSEVKAAGRLNIQSEQDISVSGSLLFGGDEINAIGKNINILSANEDYSSDIKNMYQVTGHPDDGTIGSHFIGTRKSEEDINNKGKNNRASIVESGGNINFYADENYNQIGSHINAVHEVDISAKQIQVIAAQNSADDEYKQKFTQKGLTVGVSSALTDAMQKVQDNAQTMNQSSHERVNAMSAANTAYSAYQAMNAAASGDFTPKISITYGEQHNRQSQENHQTTAQASSINGEKVKLTARNSDINIVGSDISGSLNTDLTAKNNVNILAAVNTQSEKAKNESIGAHIGVAFDVQGGSAIGVNIGGNYGKGKANGEEIAYRNSHVGSRSGKTTISAGETLNIKGGQVAGKGVAITAKDMNIESLQDTMTYNSKQHNISADMTIGYGFSGSVSGGMSKINADYASVNEQSGIFAGDDGYQINVKNHTDLKGGLITSTQKAEQDGKNRFETGTLTFADLANKAEYKGEAIGLGVSADINGGWNGKTVDSKGNATNSASSSMGYGKDSDKQYATTHSGINTANITIRDNEKQQQITGRTAEEAKRAVKTDLTIDNYAEHSGSLKNNFDKDKVQNEIDLQVKVTKEFRSNVQHFQAEQNKRKDELKAKLENNEISQADYDEQISRIQKQSLLVNMIAGGLMSPSDSVLGIATSTVSPAVSYEIGQYFKKEGKEGSFEHIATHAVLGALTSAANGGNALSGAVSAGGAEYIAKVTAETLFQKDAKDLTADEKQTVSSIAQLVGVVSGSVTGDSSANAYIGNLNAQNAVDNNLLNPKHSWTDDYLTQKGNNQKTSATVSGDQEIEKNFKRAENCAINGNCSVLGNQFSEWSSIYLARAEELDAQGKHAEADEARQLAQKSAIGAGIAFSG